MKKINKLINVKKPNIINNKDKINSIFFYTNIQKNTEKNNSSLDIL